MIQANDLRIGNLIQLIYESNRPALEERIVRVDRIDEIGVEILENGERVFGASYELLEGIPLTEEILLKCGFEKIKGKYIEDTFMNADLNFGNPVLKLNDYTMLCANGGYEYLFLDGFRIPCKYLHQLQNLTHALTNTELNITL